MDALQKYGDLVEAVGMDCEEKEYPCKDHKEAYDLARERGLFLTAHAGEDDSDQNVKDAIEILHVQRIDHGCEASENPENIWQSIKLCAQWPLMEIQSEDM